MAALLASSLLMGALWGALRFEQWLYETQPTGRHRRPKGKR